MLKADDITIKVYSFILFGVVFVIKYSYITDCGANINEKSAKRIDRIGKRVQVGGEDYKIDLFFL